MQQSAQRGTPSSTRLPNVVVRRALDDVQLLVRVGHGRVHGSRMREWHKVVSLVGENEHWDRDAGQATRTVRVALVVGPLREPTPLRGGSSAGRGGRGGV